MYVYYIYIIYTNPVEGEKTNFEKLNMGVSITAQKEMLNQFERQ